MKSMFWKIFFLFSFLTLRVFAFESIEIMKLKWNCVFDAATEQTTKLSCTDLEHYFFDKNSTEVIEESDNKVADVTVTITAQARPGNTFRYYISFVAADRLETPPLVLPWIDIDENVSVDNRRTALQNRILSGVRLYGVTGSDPNQKKQIFFEIGLKGSGKANGDVKNFNLTNSYAFSYFPKNNRMRFDLNFSATKVSQSVPGGENEPPIKGEMFVPNFSAVGLYSFDKNKRWSIGVVTFAGSAKGSNYKSYSGFETGVEYILIPFLTNQTKQLSIRAGLSLGQTKLMNANVLDHLEENLLAGFTQIQYLNQFWGGKVRLTTNAGISVYAHKGYQDFTQYSFGLQTDFKITKNLDFGFKASFNQQKKSLAYPKDSDNLNAIQKLFLPDAPGINYLWEVGAKFHLGNTSKKADDKRWLRY